MQRQSGQQILRVSTRAHPGIGPHSALEQPHPKAAGMRAHLIDMGPQHLAPQKVSGGYNLGSTT